MEIETLEFEKKLKCSEFECKNEAEYYCSFHNDTLSCEFCNKDLHEDCDQSQIKKFTRPSVLYEAMYKL